MHRLVLKLGRQRLLCSRQPTTGFTPYLFDEQLPACGSPTTTVAARPATGHLAADLLAFKKGRTRMCADSSSYFNFFRFVFDLED